MSDLMEYKCPNCGGVVEFNINTQEMTCPYCDSTFEIESLRKYEEELAQEALKEKKTWSKYNVEDGSNNWQNGETDSLASYVCESCGGVITGDKTTVVTKCPYCENPVVITNLLAGDLRPDFVIPFKFDKKQAQEKLVEFYKGKYLLPKFFSEQNRIDSIQGVYVPFWLFDCKAQTQARFNATKVRTYSDGNYMYTKTRHFSVSRGGEFKFTHVPVDGSFKMNDAYMEAIAPYDYNQMLDFETAYLSGFVADKYDVEADDVSERVSERIKNTTVQILRPSEYTSCVLNTANLNLDESNIKYALLPVWMLNTKYNGEMYTFAMNGQTGKLVGKLPVDNNKAMTYFGLICGSISAIAAAVIFFVI